MRCAIITGSFDPPTYGHKDIISRTSAMFGRVVVCVLVNKEKACSMFSVSERIALLEELCREFPNVSVDFHEGLLADYVGKYEQPVIVRGLRGVSDMEYEFQMASINRKLDPRAETVFLPSDDKYSLLSSSAVRQLSRYECDYSHFVPPCVEAAIKAKKAQP
ncbi:MAG: pantetheine-phosphate adenylyltransferase [Oscillospiraceae bacterium]|nr:pantetheine-phosphate adenylyltransferase [Oscillospiraceae bacterium]